MPVSRAYSQSTQRRRVERRGIGASLKSEFGSGGVGVSCQKYTNSAVFSATLVFERRFSKKWCFFFLSFMQCPGPYGQGVYVQLLYQRAEAMVERIEIERNSKHFLPIESTMQQFKKKKYTFAQIYRKDIPPLYHNLQLVFSRHW